MRAVSQFTITTSQLNKLKDIKGIGPKTEKYFNNLGIFNSEDLLFYFPKDYEAYKEPTKIIELEAGIQATIDAMVVTKPSVFKKGKVTITSVWLDDGSGRIRAYWFNIPFINKQLDLGSHLIFRGKVAKVKNGISLSQAKIFKPEVYESFKGNLSPIYPLTKGLNNNVIKKAIKSVLDDINIEKTADELIAKDIEYLPDNILKERKLCTLNYAINHIHFPDKMDDMLVARKRLVYDELFLFSLAMLLNKDKTVRLGRAELKDIKFEDLKPYIKLLPYELTEGQINTLNDIISDLSSGKKMNRLIEGDVGSGKTIIAILIALLFSKKKIQVAFMAPTEVLAEQHYENIKTLGLGLNIALLTGSTKAKDRKEILIKLKSGEIDILIGTHALYSSDVEYHDLGLCIIDEQHRFGVSQRKALEEKANNAQVLVMSATPIPRTLAMLLYADLDISLLKDKPAMRLPIKNLTIGTKDRQKAYNSIKKELDKKHQAYIICAAIEKNDEDDIGSFANYQNVTEYAENLKALYGKGVNVGILHGKMSTKEKYDVMMDFKNGKIDILVSTTVVEVGVDVPNATFIMIEDAGAFGLAELHQLRGRVGRGKDQSFAVFVDTMPTDKSKERLDILVKSNDGFYIADEDLKLRGPGDIFGVKQSGDMDFRLADMYTDLGTFREASVDAKEFIDKGTKMSEKLREKVENYLKAGYII